MICENLCTYVPHIRYAGGHYISYVKFHISVHFHKSEIRTGKGQTMRQWIDVRRVNQAVDLLALAQQHTELRWKASTGGGEYSGRCPFCGGTDRFSVQPEKHIWMCRNCSGGKWQDAISFGRRLWPAASFEQVCKNLAGGEVPQVAVMSAGDFREIGQAPQPQAPYSAPGAEWQLESLGLVEQYRAALWSRDGERALAYLHQRGLQDETIHHFGLGYRAYPRGISIPCFVDGVLWYVKFRQLSGGGPKYICLQGSKPAALYNADVLISGYCALAVEGEFDTMLAWQEFRDILPTFTPGSATNHLDLATWGRYLLRPNFTLILPDNDIPGQVMLKTLSAASVNPIAVSLPAGDWKDLTDFYTAGGDLPGWAMDLLQEYDPLPEDITEFAAFMGGKARKISQKTDFEANAGIYSNKGGGM